MIKEAINISAPEMAGIQVLPKDWAIISINEEQGDFYDINPEIKNPILRLRFADVGADTVKNGVIHHSINLQHAAEIINFAEEHKDKNFIIHCAAGVSRSAGVALFLHIVYGHKLKDNYYQVSHANCSVLGLLIREYYFKMNHAK